MYEPRSVIGAEGRNIGSYPYIHIHICMHIGYIEACCRSSSDREAESCMGGVDYGILKGGGSKGLGNLRLPNTP